MNRFGMVNIFKLSLLYAVSTAPLYAVDPTMPLFMQEPAPKIAAPPPKPEHYKLTSTLVSNERRVAIINDRSVGIGDRVGSAVVREITSTAVILQRAGKTITVILESEGFEKSAPRISNVERDKETSQ